MISPLQITLLSCAVLGFRHGFDYDHIAAITDITSVQQKVSVAMRLGLLYACGHAIMITVLGCAVVFFHLALPHRLDSWAERLVGVTLIVLAMYVLGTLYFGDPSALPPSRASLLIRGYHRVRRCFPSHHSDQPHVRLDQNAAYTGPAAFGVGIIHGLGAETPSQIALFLLAANLGGVSKGLWGLAMFLVGLLTMNTLMTASAAGLFHVNASRPKVMRYLMGLTAVYSLVVGILFLLGASGRLPAISG